MKSLLRSPVVQRLLAALVVGYLELITVTLRWRREGVERADALLKGEGGGLALFWHGRIPQAIACRPLLGRKPRRVMISLSRDGQFIARAAAALGVPVIHGSAGRAGAGGEKGGAAAFRSALRVIRDGELMLMTPDGPRGPLHQVQPGCLQLAREADCPVYLMSLAARPALRMGSWDEGRLPLPFARAAVVIEGPLRAPRDIGEDELRTLGAEWRDRLIGAEARAEALLDAR